MTQVINLFGGSGIGKSTLACGLFYEMKERGYHVELVREYVKQLVWEGIKIGVLDQAYIFGKQSKLESLLYDKVDYIITDSPLLLSPIYELYYSQDSITKDSVLKFIDKAQHNGIYYTNIVLERTKAFNPLGRYETEEQAKEVDVMIKTFLLSNNIPFIGMPSKLDVIMQYLKIVHNTG